MQNTKKNHVILFLSEHQLYRLLQEMFENRKKGPTEAVKQRSRRQYLCFIVL